MVRPKVGLGHGAKRPQREMQDDSSFLMELASLQENNIALAKALAKEKGLQKDMKDVETSNSILKTKCKMCSRHFKEVVNTIEAHLHVVLNQVSTFANSLMLLSSVIESEKEKNDSFLHMIEDEDTIEGSTMLKTQLVNPMVAGHTLKKASIALRRLKVSNFQPNSQVEENREAGDTRVVREGEGSPQLVQENTMQMTTMDDNLPQFEEIQHNPREREVEASSTHMSGAEMSCSGDSSHSTLINTSIERKLPAHPLSRRFPYVSVERLNIFPSSPVETEQSPVDSEHSFPKCVHMWHPIHKSCSTSSLPIPKHKMIPVVSLTDVRKSSAFAKVFAGNCNAEQKKKLPTKTEMKLPDGWSSEDGNKWQPKVSLVDMKHKSIDKTNCNTKRKLTPKRLLGGLSHDGHIGRLSPRVNLVDIGKMSLSLQDSSSGGSPCDVLSSRMTEGISLLDNCALSTMDNNHSDVESVGQVELSPQWSKGKSRCKKSAPNIDVTSDAPERDVVSSVSSHNLRKRRRGTEDEEQRNADDDSVLLDWSDARLGNSSGIGSLDDEKAIVATSKVEPMVMNNQDDPLEGPSWLYNPTSISCPWSGGQHSPSVLDYTNSECSVNMEKRKRKRTLNGM